MTKNLICLAVLLISALSYSQTLIPDPNFEQFLVDEGIDTNGITGDILNADAVAVTTLTVTRTDISDFTGLEAFTNLINLDLGQNNFLTAPLTTLTLLEEFIFDDNNILDNLDLTQNTNLRILNIGTTGSTGNASTITALDLSQNTNLESAYIYAFLNLADILLPQTTVLNTVQIIGTAKDIFDFTNLSGLEELLLNQNTSTTDITLPAVKTALKKLDIRNQRVSSIDLTGFIALEDINLGGTEVETLLLPTSNVLKRMTISRHKLPSVFSFASEPNLETLHVTSNLLATTFDVDITSNTLLENLDLSDNKMVNLDMTQNTLLVDVDVSNNQIPTFDSSQNVLLEDLDASRNVITTLDLSQNIALETLNLNTNELPTLDLATNIELRTLNLGTNELPDLDITTNTEITTLYINENLFTGTGLDLTQNGELSFLNAERNQIESLDITQNLNLSTIILNYNLFPGTAILDQFYTIRAGDNGILSGRLEVSHNLLTGQIPNFADLFHFGPADTDLWTRYFELTIDNNHFHFADLEVDHLDFTSYVNQPGAFNIPIIRKYDYAPQAKVNAIENPTPNAGESITLITDVRGAENHYQWFKDGVPIADATDSPEYIITDLDTCDNGVYHSEITSDLVPFENASPPGTNGKNLLLVRNDITLTVNITKGCVSLADPIDGATNIPINTGIEWDDNPGACGYKITIRDIDNNNILINSEDVGEATVYNYSSDFPANTNIGVTIVPYFDDGDFTCGELSFTTNATSVVPQCTSLQAPENGDTAIAIDVSNISWHPANGADAYRIAITSTSGNNAIPLTDVGDVLTYPLSGFFQSDDVVTVTIVPYNTVGDAIGPCTSESFTIEGGTPQPPLCTTLDSPANNATDVAIDIPNITWNSSAGATGYKLAIASTSGNNAMPLTDMGDVLIHPLSGPFQNEDVVTVTIVPYNGVGDATGPCTNQTFTIVSTAPQPPLCTTLNSPANNATNVAVDVQNITWNGSAGATGYRLAIASTSGNNAMPLTDVGDLLTHPFSGPFQNDDVVTVTLVPYNTVGDAVGPCTSQSFTVEGAEPQLPLCTSLVSTLSGATDVPINTAISWDEANGADGYFLAIRDASNEIILSNQDVGLLTTYTLSEDLPFGTTIFVSITPYNSEGSADPCAEQTFTTVTEAIVPTEPGEEDDTKYGFSPDGDGINEFWEIDGIENHPDNMVFIYNRWGDLVFQIEGYDNASKVFTGEANRLMGLGAGQLPSGTYFFKIQVSGEISLKKLNGYLVLKR